MASSSSARKPLDDDRGSKPQKNRSKRKLEYGGGSQVDLKNSPSTSSHSTLISYFAKAKPPSYVSCPVCSKKVDVGFINQHLDRGCVVPEKENNSASPNLSRKGTRSARKTVGPSRSGRQKAVLKEGVSNDRKRERLSRKYRSHETVESADVINISSSESVQEESEEGMLWSMSWVTNKDDHCSDSVDSDAHDSVCGKSSLDSGSSRKNQTETAIHYAKKHSSSDSAMGCKVSQTELNIRLSSSERETPKRSQKKAGGSSKSKLQAHVEEQEENADLKYTGSQSQQSSVTPQKRPVSDIEGNSSKQVLVSINKKMKLQVSRHAKLSRKSRPKHQEQSDVQMRYGEVSNLTVDRAYLCDSNSSEKNAGETFGHGATSKEVFTTPPCSQDDQGVNTPPQKSDQSRLEVPTPPTSQQSHTGSSPTSSPHKAREPYFVSNFKFILNTVLSNTDDVSLLDLGDLSTVKLFNNLSSEGQQLYVRIFQRKLAWIKVNKLDYPKIAEDLAPYAEEICQSGLFLDESQMVDLEEVLRHLPAPEMKLLTRELKVSCPDGTQKADLVAACMKHCKKQKGLFGSNLRPLMLKKAKHRLGRCIKLCQRHRAVFTRICLLFSPVLMTEDEENASGGQSQLQALLLVNFGKVIYPEYQINRTRKVFRNRDDLIRYEEALQYEHDIMAAISTNDFELAMGLWRKARASQQEILKNPSVRQYATSLPVFLQYFTALSVYEHIQYLGVEIMQKLRRYGEAVEELKLCLSSCEFRKDSRGSRWDRLALNLDQHLKDPSQALDVILAGLADGHVKTGHRLSLEQRAEKILSASKNRKMAEKRQHEFPASPLKAEDLPTITIKGKILPYTGPGVKNVFVRPAERGHGTDDNGIELCSVEQVAIDYYLQNGYTHGKHGEGTTFSTLIFLLFWEEIFMDIPDVFSYPYQTGPLDLRTDQFFSNREEALTRKLDMVRAADEGTITGWLQDIWLEHEGEACGGVNWDLMTLEEAKGLLGCMGGRFISATAERLLGSHRHCRGGMPDLVLWNTQTKKFKMSEVKGPGDRLSHKQILWIQFFQSIDSDAEVCHVQGLQSKSLKHRQVQASKSGASPRKTPKKSASKSPRHRKTPVKLRQKPN